MCLNELSVALHSDWPITTFCGQVIFVKMKLLFSREKLGKKFLKRQKIDFFFDGEKGLKSLCGFKTPSLQKIVGDLAFLNSKTFNCFTLMQL